MDLRQYAIQQAEQAGLSPELVLAQINQESGWKQGAVSPRGAVGLMQLMPATAKELGVDPTDPYQNIQGGVRYLKQQMDKFGSPELALAAYNAGPGNVQKHGGIPPFKETQNYVRNITQRAGMAQEDEWAALAKQFGQPGAGPAASVEDEWAALGKEFAQPTVAPQPVQQQVAAPKPTPAAPQSGAVTNFVKGAAQAVKQDLVAGPAQFIGKAVQGAIGLIPGIKDTDYWRGIQQNSANMDRLMKQDEAQYQAETPGSFAAGTGRLLTNVGGGLAIGGGGLVSGGEKLGRAGAGLLGMSEKAGGLLGKVAGNSALGGLFSAMTPVNQDGDYWSQKAGQIGTGMAVGGAVPLALATTKAVGGAARNALTPKISPEVAALGREAQDLGIQLRPDQITTSKPVRTLSSVLDNIPFSGKQGSLIRQQKQFNTAVSQTMGENTDNVIQAIKNADTRLGGEFDRVLKGTAVKADTIFQDDLSRIMSNALRETNDQQFSVLSRQADYLLSKVKAGDVIDGDAAYNVKKGLDRLGKSNDTTLAHYAREIRGALMDALNRSLPDGGKEFARTRQQWANKMELEKLIGHGAEGDISAARLANLRNSRSKELNKLSDISAQFLRSTTPDSGTAQRGAMTGGLLGGGLFTKPLTVGAGLTAGRGLNMLLGSPRIANAMLNGSVPPPILNGGAALTANAIPQTLMNRLTPYLLPAGTLALASGLNKP